MLTSQQLSADSSDESQRQETQMFSIEIKFDCMILHMCRQAQLWAAASGELPLCLLNNA